MKKFFTYIILALLISCYRRMHDVPPVFANTDHFVHGYWIFDDIDIDVKIHASIQDGYNPPCLRIKPSESAYLVSYLSTGDQLEEYYALCRRYNDFGYDPFGGYKPRDYVFVNRPLHVFSSIDFVSIDIVSNMDFDETHPAGTSLADITMLSTFWGRPILDGNTSPDIIKFEPYNGAAFANWTYGYRRYKRLDALTPYELSVIGMQSSLSTTDEYYEDHYREDFCIGAITFAKAPTQGFEHTFTVTLTAVDGREFKAQAYARWNLL